MSFESPEAWDFRNVVSLNRAWLGLLRRDPAARHACDPASEAHIRRIGRLSHQQAERLATAPFLLFSFRERDERLWSVLLAASGHRGLFADRGSREADALTAAGLGFIWQLARRNPYALRLICGATLYWCERIGELTFYRLLSVARNTDELPVLRAARHPKLWEKLLTSGVSPRDEARLAAQLGALQTILTESPARARRETLPLAARRTRAPGLQVADDDGPPSRS